MVKFTVFSKLNITCFEIFLPHDFVINICQAHSLFLLFDNNLSIASTLVLLSTFFHHCVTIESILSFSTLF
jgi:hypothetical protein